MWRISLLSAEWVVYIERVVVRLVVMEEEEDTSNQSFVYYHSEPKNSIGGELICEVLMIKNKFVDHPFLV